MNFMSTTRDVLVKIANVVAKVVGEAPVTDSDITDERVLDALTKLAPTVATSGALPLTYNLLTSTTYSRVTGESMLKVLDEVNDGYMWLAPANIRKDCEMFYEAIERGAVSDDTLRKMSRALRVLYDLSHEYCKRLEHNSKK